MYIPDGSNQDYAKGSHPNNYAWGWLGNSVPENPKINPDLLQAVVDYLQTLTPSDHVDHCYGSHSCEICNSAPKPVSVRSVDRYSSREEFFQALANRDKPKEVQPEENLRSWNGSLKVSHRGVTYICPSSYAVIHYITKHGYVPPIEAVKALLSQLEV